MIASIAKRLKVQSLASLKGKWNQPKVAREVNEYHLITFDPGAVATGWAHFVVDFRAFSRPENKVLRWLKYWNCGQFTGTEPEQYTAATSLVWRAKFGEGQFHTRTDVVGEDFDLVQTIGGTQLLAPERLNAFGFEGRWSTTAKKGKDAFSAMQHGVVWLRRLKDTSRMFPWKLSDTVGTNAYWDCGCSSQINPDTDRPFKHDLTHP